MTIRIRIFSSFGDSSKCKEIYERLCESTLLDNYGPDKEIYITNDEDYTHVLILNTAMPKIPSHIPKKNVVGLAFEPIVFLGLTQEFVNYAIQNIGKYFIGDTMGLPLPFVENFSFMWYNPPLSESPKKTKLMSMMVSEKTSQDGHKYRHQLIQQILQTDLPIDIYGRGCQYYKHLNDPRIKGEFKETEPYNDYHFHICIENCESNHYFSEKLINPLLAETVPIYKGCKNINGYFPNMVISLSGDVSNDIELFCQIVLDSQIFKKQIKVDNVKRIVYLLSNIKAIYL
jgi:Glycosyltransferase family 10 (fucosyltransferase) C-term